MAREIITLALLIFNHPTRTREGKLRMLLGNDKNYIYIILYLGLQKTMQTKHNAFNKRVL